MNADIHVYIAGPFRAKTKYQLRRNIEHARDEGYKVALLNATPVIPHTMFGDFDGELTDEFWLNATQGLLRRCDMIYLIDGWKDSTGSRGELGLARKLELPIAYDLDKVKEILTGLQLGNYPW